jgi:hypothetical protein
MLRDLFSINYYTRIEIRSFLPYVIFASVADGTAATTTGAEASCGTRIMPAFFGRASVADPSWTRNSVSETQFRDPASQHRSSSSFHALEQNARFQEHQLQMQEEHREQRRKEESLARNRLVSLNSLLPQYQSRFTATTAAQSPRSVSLNGPAEVSEEWKAVTATKAKPGSKEWWARRKQERERTLSEGELDNESVVVESFRRKLAKVATVVDDPSLLSDYMAVEGSFRGERDLSTASSTSSMVSGSSSRYSMTSSRSSLDEDSPPMRTSASSAKTPNTGTKKSKSKRGHRRRRVVMDGTGLEAPVQAVPKNKKAPIKDPPASNVPMNNDDGHSEKNIKKKGAADLTAEVVEAGVGRTDPSSGRIDTGNLLSATVVGLESTRAGGSDNPERSEELPGGDVAEMMDGDGDTEVDPTPPLSRITTAEGNYNTKDGSSEAGEFEPPVLAPPVTLPSSPEARMRKAAEIEAIDAGVCAEYFVLECPSRLETALQHPCGLNMLDWNIPNA